MNKIITIEEAVRQVPDGCTLGIGGMTLYRRPMAFVKALIRRKAKEGKPKNLTLLSFTASIESDLLVGAGIISRVRTCYFGLEIFGLAPMFTCYANRGEIEVIEESEASLAFGLRAHMTGVGFMPARAWIGTDMLKLRPDVQTIIDPYSGEELIAFPAIHPEFSVIHALRADPDGNAQIGENKAIDEELTLASDRVIVTAEEIVPELEMADLVSPVVHGVVYTPKGASPTSCHPLYPVDGNAILAYTEQVSDPETFSRYLTNLLD
jgi:glutaconate CoA-transferase subunit A